MRWTFKFSSIFHRWRSFPRVLACALWRSTSSTCCFERSSALITALLRMSRSWSRSMICLLSTSACLFKASISLVRTPISFFSSFLAVSRRCVSRSPASFFFLRTSVCFCSLAFPLVRALISSCFIFCCTCISELSLVNFSSLTTSSCCDFFSDSRWLSKRSCDNLRRSISCVSSLSCFSSCRMASPLRLISSLRELISFWRCSMVCLKSFRSLSSFSFLF
mmetsp:Transcript_59195/g.137863  ORF Transcript_59195/g.137863 Transcript_59195/m.137863 type:complete len:221 (-) Transcript_59195:650-1312(-)